MNGPQFISSAANPLMKDLRKLANEPSAYRKLGRIWLEGDHLCDAALVRNIKPQLAVYAQSLWDQGAIRWGGAADREVIVPDALFAAISGLESPARVGFIIDVPERPTVDASAPSVILDRVQDAGNVGSILRSAAAFGFTQIIAMTGTAALWSPKVLRAGMGAHFALSLVEKSETHEIDALQVPIIATSSHQGEFIHQATLPWPCAWLMGHEGQGVDESLAWRAKLSVRIAQPGGEESLNVAAAAAICLHASATVSGVAPNGPHRSVELKRQ